MPHLWWSGGWCTRRAATRWGTGWTAWWSWCHWRWRGTRAPPPAPPGYFSWVSLLHPSWRLLIILSRCHNWRIIALKSKGWSLEELNRHSKATQFLLSISWIQIRVPLKPHNCCILAELSTRTRDKRWWWHIISVSQIIFPRLKKIWCPKIVIGSSTDFLLSTIPLSHNDDIWNIRRLSVSNLACLSWLVVAVKWWDIRDPVSSILTCSGSGWHWNTATVTFLRNWSDRGRSRSLAPLLLRSGPPRLRLYRRHREHIPSLSSQSRRHQRQAIYGLMVTEQIY